MVVDSGPLGFYPCYDNTYTNYYPLEVKQYSISKETRNYNISLTIKEALAVMSIGFIIGEAIVYLSSQAERHFSKPVQNLEQKIEK